MTEPLPRQTERQRRVEAGYQRAQIREEITAWTHTHGRLVRESHHIKGLYIFTSLDENVRNLPGWTTEWMCTGGAPTLREAWEAFKVQFATLRLLGRV